MEGAHVVKTNSMAKCIDELLISNMGSETLPSMMKLVSVSRMLARDDAYVKFMRRNDIKL
ncbi:hypothetical protein PY95_01880 [Lacticaseibacillus rhamnosus]|nr:hypothetical protein PY95_01880 [Lacticaseibacillus rhamnosus]OAU06058.1 hypothetical protein PY72_01880 [Lacticaseibacillus rhamnosus]